MNNRVLHTPDGFRDIYGAEQRERRSLMHSLREVFARYGYDEIATPSVEYFDVFSSDIGTTPSRELYKFFDRDGNTLVLRPDFTPSVARAVAMHYPPSAMPARLSYEGSTFVNSAEYQGRLKETRQMGVELIGDGSPQADAEIIALTCELLSASGLTEFQVSVGEVDFFKALAEASGLPEETVETVRAMISSKNFFGAEELLSDLPMDNAIREALSAMPQLFGDEEVLKEARKYQVNSRCRDAIDRLCDIHKLMTDMHLDRYVSYDFGSLSKYTYYTGIIFSAFTYGTGEPIAKGGRYDQLLAHFGTPYPAVGVGVDIDQLMSARIRQGLILKEEMS